jgi:hypothetical protein
MSAIEGNALVVPTGLLGEARPSEMARLLYHNMRRDRDRGHWAPVGSGNLHRSRHVTFKTIRRIGAWLAEARR